VNSVQVSLQVEYMYGSPVDTLPPMVIGQQGLHDTLSDAACSIANFSADPTSYPLARDVSDQICLLALPVFGSQGWQCQ
jgi:hypothetical protein